MNTGNPEQNLVGMQVNTQRTDHVSNYDSQFVSAYDQQHVSFQNDNEYGDHTHTSGFFPSKNREGHKANHVEGPSWFLTDFDEEETAIWNKDPTNTVTPQRFSTRAENQAAEDSILKEKDVDAYDLHEDVSRYDWFR